MVAETASISGSGSNSTSLAPDQAAALAATARASGSFDANALAASLTELGAGDPAAAQTLQAQVEALQEALDGVKSQQVKAVPTWKGGPEFADKEAGFTFKPKGFAQFDAGYVGFPDGDERRDIDQQESAAGEV